MDGLAAQLAAMLPFLVLGQGALVLIVWRASGGRFRSPLFVLPPRPRDRLPALFLLAVGWLAITAVTLWCAYLTAFLAVHLVLFWFGVFAAWVAFAAAVPLLAAVPLGWGWLLLRETRVRHA